MFYLGFTLWYKGNTCGHSVCRRHLMASEEVRIMSKRTWVGFGGSRWRGPNFAAAVIGLVAAGLIVAGGLTGGLGVPPGVVVEAAQQPCGGRGLRGRAGRRWGLRCMRGSAGSAMG